MGIRERDGRYVVEVEKDGWVYRKDLVRTGAKVFRIHGVKGLVETREEKTKTGYLILIKPLQDDIDYIYEGLEVPAFVDTRGDPYTFPGGEQPHDSKMALTQQELKGLVSMRTAIKNLGIKHGEFADLICRGDVDIKVQAKHVPGRGEVAYITDEEYELLKIKLELL